MPRTKKVQDEPKLLSDTIDMNASIDYEKLGDLATPIPENDSADAPRKRRGRPAKKATAEEESVPPTAKEPAKEPAVEVSKRETEKVNNENAEKTEKAENKPASEQNSEKESAPNKDNQQPAGQNNRPNNNNVSNWMFGVP